MGQQEKGPQVMTTNIRGPPPGMGHRGGNRWPGPNDGRPQNGFGDGRGGRGGGRGGRGGQRGRGNHFQSPGRGGGPRMFDDRRSTGGDWNKTRFVINKSDQL